MIKSVVVLYVFVPMFHRFLIRGVNERGETESIGAKLFSTSGTVQLFSGHASRIPYMIWNAGFRFGGD